MFLIRCDNELFYDFEDEQIGKYHVLGKGPIMSYGDFIHRFIDWLEFHA